jgi:tripartite ATP-independent transporter DctP family solute receptor
MKRLMIKTVLAAAALAVLGVASAQDIKERTLKLGLQNPKGHPLEQGATRFAEIVAAKSGGKLKVNVFPGGVLGGDAATVSALQGGTVEITVLNSGILASQVKDFEVYDFPFMFASAREADAVVDGPFGQKLHAKLADKAIVGLAYWELGFRNMSNSRRPITKVEDIAGLKLRVIPNPINIDWVKALDANPTPLAFPELYAALEQKAVDGQENPFSVILANKFAEVQKHLAVTNHQYNPQSFIFSKKVWDTLIGAGIQRSLTPAGMQEAEAAAQGRWHPALRAHYQLIDLDRSGVGVDALPTADPGRQGHGVCRAEHHLPLQAGGDAAARWPVGRGAGHGGGQHRGVPRWPGHRPQHRRQRLAPGASPARLPQADLSRVVLLGSGGAGSAIAHAVLRLGAGSLALVDTDGARARALADRLNGLYGPGRVTAGTDATTVVPDATGLIHATPTGMAKLPGLPLDAALLRPGLWVAEIVYFPLETALLQAARAAGCPVSDGGGMAVGQAVGAFELFTGRPADPARMRAHFLQMVADARCLNAWNRRSPTT